MPVWQIDDAKWKELGSHLNKTVRIDGDDKIISAILIRNFDTFAWIVTVSSGGQIKKSNVRDFAVQRNNRVMPAMSMKKGDVLLKAFLVYQGDQVLVVSRDGLANRFGIDQIPVMGVRTRGVKAQNYGKGDAIASACPLAAGDSVVLFLTANGQMKRVKLEEIPENNRPAKGNLICKRIKSNPSVLKDVQAVASGDELQFYDPQLQVIRASEIPLKSVGNTFSAPLVLKDGWVLHKGISECRIIDIPEGMMEEGHEDVEKLSLFDGEDAE